MAGAYVGGNPQDRHIAVDANRIHVFTGPDGRFRPTTLDGKPVGRQEGAIGAVVAGSDIHAFFTLKTPGVNEDGKDALIAHDDVPMGGKSALAISKDGGRTFIDPIDVSTRKFLWTVPEIVDAADIRGLPSYMTGKVVLIWGAGREDMQGRQTPFHRSYPYLMAAPLAKLRKPSTWRYFSGVETTTRAVLWTDLEAGARAVEPFGTTEGLIKNLGDHYHECLGYFTVRRIEAWHKWVMLYACGSDTNAGYNPRNGGRGIFIRKADTPWGPWSAPQLLFDPAAGYCHFIHSLNPCPADAPNPVEEAVRKTFTNPSTRGTGGEYAPILLPSRYQRGTADNGTLYFLMGTWNPYQVVLMRTQVKSR